MQVDRDFATRAGHIEQAPDRGPIQQSAITVSAKHNSPDAIFEIIVCHHLHPSCFPKRNFVQALDLIALAQQCFTAVLHSSIAQQYCTALLDSSVAQQYCTAELYSRFAHAVFCPAPFTNVCCLTLHALRLRMSAAQSDSPITGPLTPHAHGTLHPMLMLMLLCTPHAVINTMICNCRCVCRLYK